MLKIKRFMLVGMIVLAILMIGAVSASDNVTSDDAVAVESNSDNALGDGVYYDNDFYVTAKEDYSQDKPDWDSNDIVYISSYSQKNGTFKVYVDDSEKKSYDITDGHFAVEDGYNRYYQYVYPNDIGIVDCGKYAIKVKFNDTTLVDTLVNVAEKEDFDIWLQNPYYCEEDYWDYPGFIVIDSNHQNTGTLEILVNGTCKISYNVVSGNFTPEVADCRNTSRYVAASDLFNGYGIYRIQINFTENGSTRSLRDETVTVAEFEPTTDPKLEVYLNFPVLHLLDDNMAYIYLPREATGKLTVTYNNVKDEAISYSKGRGTYGIPAWNLNHLGENTLTFKYVGNDFGTLQTTVTCTVVPSITSPSYVSVGEKFEISMITHDWVNGDFNVYDYNSGKKGKLLASGTISGGKSSVKLSSSAVGLNRFYLEFAYPGGYYPLVQELHVVENSENITVSVPSEVNVGSDVVVNITAPATSINFAYITVDGVNYGFFSMENGSVVETFSGLAKGYHTISVQYNDGYYTDGKLIGDVYSNTFTVSVGLQSNIVASPVNTVYNVAKNLVVTLKDSKNAALSGKTITVKLNGVTYTRTTNSNGQAVISVNLPAKTYTAAISFAGDDIYLASSKNVNVVVVKATPKITAKAKTFKLKTKTKKFTAVLKDNKGRAMKKVKLTLKVKGKTYKATTNTKGKATFKITKLNKKGSYKAKITFNANSNYKSASKTVKIKVK